MEASCIIVCEGAGVSMTIKKLAQERGCTVLTTPYDTYTAARLINQSMPISYFMTKDNLITFGTDDFIDDIRDVMASKRHRDFPILDKDGKYKGMISRRNLLGARGKNLILVDHNERSQAVEGMDSANVLEIIDHHRLGTVETMSPVFFRNQPLGCTGTIIYQMYNENKVEIDRKTAGLLCSAIISDTLLFRSPTCTPMDQAAALNLAQIAGIDAEEFAKEVFEAGSKLKGKTASAMEKLRERLLKYIGEARQEQKVDMMFFMMTNILEQSTDLICDGQGAEQLAAAAFHLREAANVVKLPGVVSRKKQLIPGLMIATEQ